MRKLGTGAAWTCLTKSCQVSMLRTISCFVVNINSFEFFHQSVFYIFLQKPPLRPHPGFSSFCSCSFLLLILCSIGDGLLPVGQMDFYQSGKWTFTSCRMYFYQSANGLSPSGEWTFTSRLIINDLGQHPTEWTFPIRRMDFYQSPNNQ